MTDNEKKIDEDLQRAAEEFFAAKVSQGYSPDHATALLQQRFHQVREAIIVKDRRKALRVVDDNSAGRRAIVSYLKTQA
jgi:hypothetical protein